MEKSCLPGLRHGPILTPTAVRSRSWASWGGGKQRAAPPQAAVDPNLFSDHIPSIIGSLHLAYERVALPCSTLNCGDVIYRR